METDFSDDRLSLEPGQTNDGEYATVRIAFPRLNCSFGESVRFIGFGTIRRVGPGLILCDRNPIEITSYGQALIFGDLNFWTTYRVYVDAYCGRSIEHRVQMVDEFFTGPGGEWKHLVLSCCVLS